MILKNGKIFNGEKFIKENCVILEGRIIKKYVMNKGFYFLNSTKCKKNIKN